ncbi:MAG: DUF433 domain-containing protein [Paracoccaceae bacterium]|nr:DUF433 domain-containing protein [Paracoccaceae bacterium]
MEDSNLTVGEISSLVGVPKKEINKYIESKVVTAQKPNGQYLLPKQAVLFFAVICKDDINILPHSSKKEIWNKLLEVIDTSTGVEAQGRKIHFDPRIRDLWNEAKRYINFRSQFLVENPEILGGTPVIKGTRITAYSVRGWLKGDETIDDLSKEYPDIPPEAFEVAEFYAKSNPLYLYGRRKGLPR